MLRRVLFAAALVLVAGCNGSSNSVPPGVTATPSPTPSPTPTPTPAPQHLYVGNDNAAGQILQYTLPVTASSTANFGFASANNVSIGVDASGNLIAGDNAGHLTYFAAPLSASSVPTATFTNGSAVNDGQIAVTTAGDIFVPTVGAATNGFTHPFSNASTPSSTITNAGITSAIGAAFDASANLYVSNAGATSNLFVFAPPYTGAPIAIPKIAKALALTVSVTVGALVAENGGAYTVIVALPRLPTYRFPAASNASASGKFRPVVMANAGALAAVSGSA